MKNLGRLAFSAVALVVTLLLRTPVTGAPIEVALDADKFGKLDQKLTKCGDIGCGPTAAVNSFTYLQTAFPNSYKTPLVPAGQEVMVADTLADLMGCCGAGTSIENFIRGKRSYVESKDPGATKYGAELSGKWTGTDRPDFVHENATATDLLAFIERELRAAEDVEISIANAGVGHFLTLTGITFEDETRQRGQLTFVDPNGGTRGSTTFRIDANGDIRTTYVLGAQIAFVRHAVSESPVPELSTLVLLAAGLIGLGGASWRGRRPK
jgi:hypothetical protein